IIFTVYTVGNLVKGMNDSDLEIRFSRTLEPALFRRRMNDPRYTGFWPQWRNDGSLLSLTHYSHGELSGKEYHYFISGIKQTDGINSNGEKNGVWVEYQPNGTIK